MTDTTQATGLTTEQIDALIDAHRWDTTEGRRAIVRAALAVQATQAVELPWHIPPQHWTDKEKAALAAQAVEQARMSDLTSPFGAYLR